MSPSSLHDSGVEEQEDAALVPTETLCELLRRAFKLTPEKFSHYEKIVIAHIDKKSPQKVITAFVNGLLNKKKKIGFVQQNFSTLHLFIS